MQPNSESSNSAKDIYKLKLNPTAGSQYHYEISSESSTRLEVGEKKQDNSSKSEVAVEYSIGKDSLGDFIIKMIYDKVKLYTKNGETETTINADNASTSNNPTEKVLGMLKNANVTAMLNPSGQVIKISGYQQIADSILGSITSATLEEKTMMQKRWKQTMEEGMIKKNMEQLFKIFPDSAVHVGDKWKIFSKQHGEFGLNVKTFYTLKAINDGVANIESVSELSSDSAVSELSGYTVTTDLKGEEEGVFAMEVKTGMLLRCNTRAKVKGTVQMMGREIPVEIETSTKLEGRKVK